MAYFPTAVRSIPWYSRPFNTLITSSLFLLVGCQDANRESTAGLCAKWKDLGSCTNHISLMEVYCKRTCGFCREYDSIV